MPWRPPQASLRHSQAKRYCFCLKSRAFGQTRMHGPWLRWNARPLLTLHCLAADSWLGPINLSGPTKHSLVRRSRSSSPLSAGYRRRRRHYRYCHRQVVAAPPSSLSPSSLADRRIVIAITIVIVIVSPLVLVGRRRLRRRRIHHQHYRHRRCRPVSYTHLTLPTKRIV